MARIEKTVFISYRRSDVYTALAVYENLKNQGYDVFFDYRSISSGDFEQIITSNIRARAHFLLILTPTALDRCNEPGDWLRREIELAIDERRNIIPLFFRGFRFGDPSITQKLTGKLQNLSRYNGLNVHEDYFDEAVHRLRTQYLNIPLNTVLHPVSTEVRQLVREEQIAADEALEQIENVKDLVKHSEQKFELPNQKQKIAGPPEISKKNSPENVGKLTPKDASLKANRPGTPHADVRTNTFKPVKNSSRLFGIVVAVVFLFALCSWGGWRLLKNLITPSTQTPTDPPNMVFTAAALTVDAMSTEFVTTPTPTLQPTSRLGIGSTLTGNDGMTLLYVPAGEFTMGSDSGEKNEKPVHTVSVQAYWIDKTEVTNEMFSKCVQDGGCNPPLDGIYYDDSSYADHPVVYITWTQANSYCSWAGRKLPTEAEWEKAASWDMDNHVKYVYPWGNDFDGHRLNFCDSNCPENWAEANIDDGSRITASVGTYPNGSSPYGALDMAGNVWEWVEDWYDAYPGNTDNNSLYGTTYRVLRGNAWPDHVSLIRSTYRNWNFPVYAESYVGFRCAMSASP